MENNKVLTRALTQLETINESIAETLKDIELLQRRSKAKEEQDAKDLQELETQLNADPFYSTEEVRQVLQDTSDSQDMRFYENYAVPLERQQAHLERLQQDKTIYEYFIKHNKIEGEQ